MNEQALDAFFATARARIDGAVSPGASMTIAKSVSVAGGRPAATGDRARPGGAPLAAAHAALVAAARVATARAAAHRATASQLAAAADAAEAHAVAFAHRVRGELCAACLEEAALEARTPAAVVSTFAAPRASPHRNARHGAVC